MICPEWFLCAQALFRLGAAVATLYATLGLEGIVHGINETEVEHVVTTEDLLPNLLKVIERCPKVRKIIVIELHPGLLKTKVTQDDFRKAVGQGRSFDLISYKKMILLGKDISENEVTITNPKPEDVAIILYTSGNYYFRDCFLSSKLFASRLNRKPERSDHNACKLYRVRTCSAVLVERRFVDDLPGTFVLWLPASSSFAGVVRRAHVLFFGLCHRLRLSLHHDR